MARKEIASAAPTFPPYGPLSADLAWAVQRQRVGTPFLLKSGEQATAQQFAAFLDAVSAEYAQVLWPRWEAGGWVGAAAAGVLDLTLADLDLYAGSLKGKLVAAVGADALSAITHKKLFVFDDQMPADKMFASLDPYLATMEAEPLAALKASMTKALRSVLGAPPLRLKVAHQRPRPYQASFILGRTDFGFEEAKSSMTPALPSGHALQGLFAACGGYLDQRAELEKVAGAIPALQQYGVDMGDRRTFAGVHYPSDNLASWYLALRLCDHCFGVVGQDAKRFMVAAIECSTVFMAMKAAAAAGGAYQLPVAWLEREMHRPADTPEP